MNAKVNANPLWLKILRWCARIITILFIVFILGMFIGEGGTWSQPKNLPLGFRDYALLSLFGFYVVGLVIGLWREGLGGLISIVFMITQIAILASEGHSHLTYFYLMLVPSLLYLLSWYFHRMLARKQSQLGQ
ncbi:MAG: hypothetical protein NTX61_05440 [Bacteroidetes bacterium]|nr:hypothetical protein [Bacteroidota bacterium]